MFGFRVYPDFTPDSTRLEAPSPKSEPTPFGHAVLAVGYDSTRRYFRIRNSWGPESNDQGHFDMAYDYILNSHLASAFWTVLATEARVE